MSNEILDQNFDDENLEQSFHYAGFWYRFIAAFMDGLILMPLILFQFYNMISLKSALLEVVIVGLLLAYKPYLEHAFGRTWGKQMFRMNVIDRDRNKISLNQALIRNSPWIASYLLTGIANIMLFHESDQTGMSAFLELTEARGTLALSSISQLISIFLFVSGIYIAIDQYNQAIHDKMANTFVIRDPSY